MDKKYQRREIVKLMALSGFSLILPSCGIGAEKNPKELKEKPKKESLPAEPKKPFDYFNSQNVSYFQKDQASYAENNISFNLRIQQKPKIIALCQNSEGVQEAVQYAIENELAISVKSGGHSFEGFSSNDGGMQINLSLMNKLSWGENDTIIAQPAALLRDLYDFTLPKKKILPAGSCGTVGLGGLALGGGYGFFSRKYGLSCDHLLEASMVDGDARLIKTQDNPELLWALKGGGNGNFGIVTEMKFKSQNAPASFTRHRFKAFKLDVERANSILKIWFEESGKLPDHAFSAFVLNRKTLTILLTHYEDLDSRIDSMIHSLEVICDKTSKGGPRNLAKSLKTYYGVQYPIPFKNSSAGYYKNYAHIEKFIEPVLEKIVNGAGLIFQINTLGGKIGDDKFEEKSCYPHRKMAYLSELQAYWEEGRNPDSLLSEFDEVQNIIYENGIHRQYRNYPNLNFKNWDNAYWGEENYKELQKIKMQYDPKNRISHPQSVKPIF
tara:strand:+ start:1910 stop:3397 length:1488 start_codon:yes stop_codon:yes gene_type:complete